MRVTSSRGSCRGVPPDRREHKALREHRALREHKAPQEHREPPVRQARGGLLVRQAVPQGRQVRPARPGSRAWTTCPRSFGPYPAGTQYGGEASCAGGQHAVGGGVVSDGSNARQQAVNSSYPSDGSGSGDPGNTAWTAYVDNTSATMLGFTVYVVCAPAGTVTGP